MSYIDQTELENRIGEDYVLQLADFDQDGEVDAEPLAAAIADAEGLINDYCRGSYTIPLTPVPESIIKSACVLTIYFLKHKRQTLDDQANKDYDREIAFLKDISTGKVKLGSTTSAAASSDSSDDAYSSTAGTTTTLQDSLEDF